MDSRVHEVLRFIGAGDGSRTRDLSFTKAVLYQLSYASPVFAEYEHGPEEGRIATSQRGGNRPSEQVRDRQIYPLFCGLGSAGGFDLGHLAMRVIGTVSLGDLLAAEVVVDLGGGEMFVAEQFLHLPQIGTTVEQVRRIRVAQGMGTGSTVEARLADVSVEDLADRSIGNAITEAIQQNRVRAPVSILGLPACRDGFLVTEESGQRMLADGNDALLASLSKGANQSRRTVDVEPVERDQFTDPETGAVEDFEDGSISQPAVRVGLWLIE